MTCQWNETWSGHQGQLPRCKAIACVNPPIPINGTRIIRTYENDTLIPFGDKILYHCEPGHFFDDYDFPGFNLTCLNDGNWTTYPEDLFCVHPSGTPFFAINNCSQ